MSNFSSILFVINYIFNSIIIYMLLKYLFSYSKELDKVKVQKYILLLFIKNNILGGEKMSIEDVEKEIITRGGVKKK